MDDFDRILAVTVDEMKSPKQRASILARFARDEIAATAKAVEAETGRKSKPAISVDGRKGGNISQVKPNGVVVAEFNTEIEVVRWVLRQLEMTSPRKTGRYAASHRLFVDGVEHIGGGDIPEARFDYVILSDSPYARKIEGNKGGRPPQSDQAPRGVYQAVAAVAARRFSHEAKVRYEWHAIEGEDRQPAIVIDLGGTAGEL